MAYVALTSLMATIELEFLQSIPRVSLDDDDDQPAIKPFFQGLTCLREFLEIFKFGSVSAPRELEIKIRDFALEAEDNIEIQLSNFLLLPKHEQEEASLQKLCRTLREAAEDAAELLKISNISKDGETERKITCDALTSLMMEIQNHFALRNAPGLQESLIENLSSLREFVEISNFHDDAAIKDLATKIRDFAFKSNEDIKLQPFRGLSINELRKPLEEVAENTADLLNSINNNSTGNEAPIPIQPDGSLRCSPNFEDTVVMVGRQNDVTIIKDKLFGGTYGLGVIPIIGLPGIGKTTLARTIFEDQLVTQHFQVKIWFTMPRTCNEIQIQKDLLCSIILAVQHEIKERTTVTEMVQEFFCIKERKTLHEVVQEFLEDRTYLIVLDDIWSTQHGDHIKYCFPRDLNGSCILMTTRFFEVADYATATVKLNHHVMSFLDPNESWDLFCNIFPLQNYKAPRFESFRSHLSNVVDKCDGLPQVIVTLADRLSKCKDNIQHELKRIEKEIELLGILDYNSALALIYNKLPEYLKACFFISWNLSKA